MARRHKARTRVWNRQPRARDRAWTSMRILQRFTVADLTSTAEMGEANAKKYVRGLTRAGYLRIAKAKVEGKKGGHTIYLLIRNTGPKGPRLQTDGNAYDPNEHKVYEGGIEQ